jgi:phosphoheptose isomerase
MITNPKLTAAIEEAIKLRGWLLEKAGPDIEAVALRMSESFRNGGKTLLFGNGGSAADAQHISAEFTGRFVKERRSLPAIALTTDTSALTAIGNDYGYDRVFVRQLDGLAVAGDVAIGITTSGKSPNVLAAIKRARALGLFTVGLTGVKHPDLAQAADICFSVPSPITARIQECHIMICHLICELVEENLFTGKEPAPVRAGEGKIFSVAGLQRRRAEWREQQKIVAWTNGCFDVLHAGHVHSLQDARRLADVLIVGLNSDASVRRLKGSTRPVFPQQERAVMLSALGCVDAVVIFDEDTPEAALRALQPDIHCKGADYAPPSGKPIPEAELVKSYGGRLAFLPLVAGLSTSNTIERIISGC